ncbi:MAG: hypothetical protein IJ451_07045 [Ruminococcus sp.]|nr:hypothetical protein [Ruminococcus sp.]
MKKISILCIFLCFLLSISSVPFMVSAKEAELASSGESSVYYIETYEQLKNHAFKAQADCRYILNDNIDQQDNLNDQEIVIPAGAVFNLDLNGYNIKRSTQGNDCALFRIKSDGRMTINDTSANKTGGCCFSEGYSDYYKAVFYNDGGELEILNGYYEILSPYEQGDCCIVRTTSGYTNIYDGTFDSSYAWGGNTIYVGHNAYLYDVPQVVIFGGEFYGKYMNIEVTPFDNYLNHGCLFPSVYVLGGNFYITNGGKDGDDASFAYCNNGWGRVIVAEGTVLYRCINMRDQMFLSGVSKEYFTQTIDDYKDGYYKVTAPPMIMSEGIDYYYRLIGKCDKEMVNSYGESVYELNKEKFDDILERIDTIMVSETEKNSPEIKLVNRTTDHIYINWYMCDESSYNGADTKWTYLGDYDNVSQWQFDERPEDATSYIIRCVVTNSDLTTCEDMIRIVYSSLKETETVSSVEIKGLNTPAAGDTPDFDLIPADESFYINKVYWTDVTDPKNKATLNETDIFEEGHTYELEVWIRANEYYQFKLDSDDCIDISAAVDGNKAEVILPGSAISAELTLTYIVPAEPVTTDATESTEPTGTNDSTEPTELTKPADSTNPTESSTLVTDGETLPTETFANDTTKPDASTSAEATEPKTSASEDEEKPTKPSANDEPKPTDPVEDKGVLGDVNGDDKVNVKDATLIQKSAAKITVLTDVENLRADVNADMKINVKDATAIQKYAAKIETGLPIGKPIQ